MYNKNFSSDTPVVAIDKDKFNRAHFSKNVAKVIANRTDPSSIVVGIYGEWGYGKTSVLNFIDSELRNSESRIECVRFNPWRYSTEEQLLKDFFESIAKAINRSIITKTEKAGGFFKRFVPTSTNNAIIDTIIGGVTNFLEAASLEKLKNRIENALAEEEIRVVIFIDDIDRLDKQDIHSVFRLVKLTADFKYTSYILSFDYEMVRSVLEERYGMNSKGGATFLEKIIQVPLRLPEISKQMLKNYLYETVDNALLETGVTLSQQKRDEFSQIFWGSLEYRFKTPRQVNLYGNVLRFSLQILKDEVNLVDQMLIEAIGVLDSDLYNFIYKNSNFFIRGKTKGSNFEDFLEKLDKLLSKYSEEEKKSIDDLITYLFPRINRQNNIYSLQHEYTWEQNQRICTNKYFVRSFTYSIAPDDISDAEVKRMLDSIPSLTLDELQNKIRELINIDNIDYLTAQLRHNANVIQSNDDIGKLARALMRIENILSEISFNSLSQIAYLIVGLIEKIENKSERLELVLEMIQTTESIDYLAALSTWIRKDSKDRPDIRGFNNEEMTVIYTKFATRIKNTMESQGELIVKNVRLHQLLHIWKNYGKSNEVDEFIEQVLVQNPEISVDLLFSFLPTSWGEFGGRISDLEQDEYINLTKILNPNIVYTALMKVYGDNLDIKEYKYIGDDNTPTDLRVSQQFVWLYKKQSKKVTDQF